MRQLLEWRLDAQRYALDHFNVVRVERAAAVAPLPGAPAGVLGVINVRGEILPVLDLRQRFGLPARAIHPADQLVLVQTPARRLAFFADQVSSVAAWPDEAILQAAELGLQDAATAAVVRLPDGLILIQDMDRFLAQEEAALLDRTLAAAV